MVDYKDHLSYRHRLLGNSFSEELGRKHIIYLFSFFCEGGGGFKSRAGSIFENVKYIQQNCTRSMKSDDSVLINT